MADAAAIAVEMVEKVNSRDLEGFREMLHPDYNFQDAGGPVQKGVEVGVGVAQAYTTAFPDLKLTVTNQYTDRDVPIIEFTATGTHRAKLEGIAATGKPITVNVADVVTVSDGRVIGEREYYDKLA